MLGLGNGQADRNFPPLRKEAKVFAHLWGGTAELSERLRVRRDVRCFWSGFGRLLILVLVFVAVASASTATGDELAVSRGQRLVETSHRVDVTIENGTSTMIVRRTLENRGDAPNGTVLLARLPRGAAVTGFRTKVGTVWHAGEFVEADNLTEFDAGPVESNPRIPRTPMLLSWVGSDEVELRVFSVPGGARRTFEYTLTVPTAYENGRYSVTYPRATNGLATPQVKIRAPAGSSASGIAIDSRRVPGWKWTPLREPPASTDTSGIELTGSEDAVKAEVSVDIAHPYRGDLSVSLVPPIGDRIPLTTRTGGDEDNVTESFSVGLPNETPIGGIWSLSVVDHASLDVGTLRKWKVVVTAASGRTE